MTQHNVQSIWWMIILFQRNKLICAEFITPLGYKFIKWHWTNIIVNFLYQHTECPLLSSFHNYRRKCFSHIMYAAPYMNLFSYIHVTNTPLHSLSTSVYSTSTSYYTDKSTGLLHVYVQYYIFGSSLAFHYSVTEINYTKDPTVALQLLIWAVLLQYTVTQCFQPNAWSFHCLSLSSPRSHFGSIEIYQYCCFNSMTSCVEKHCESECQKLQHTVQ